MNRNETVISMRSLTHAIKAKKLLQDQGFEAKVVKPDAHKAEKGCGYGIAVSANKAELINTILQDNGLTP